MPTELGYETLTSEEIKAINDLGYKCCEVHSGTFTFEKLSNEFIEIVIQLYYNNPSAWKNDLWADYLNYKNNDKSNSAEKLTKEEICVLENIFNNHKMKGVIHND